MNNFKEWLNDFKYMSRTNKIQIVVAGVAITIGIGLYGNYMYLNHMEKKITDINHYDSNLREVMIRKKGGTNIVLPILIIILPIIVVILMMLVLFGSMLIYGL